MNIENIKEYTLQEKKELKDIDSIGYVLRHNKSGARVILIENDDNKEKVQQLKFIDNKKNKIIIRDPKHSTYSFFGILAKILVLIIKLN